MNNELKHDVCSRTPLSYGFKTTDGIFLLCFCLSVCFLFYLNRNCYYELNAKALHKDSSKRSHFPQNSMQVLSDLKVSK